MNLKSATQKAIELIGEEGLSGITVQAQNATEAFSFITNSFIQDRSTQKKVFDQLKRQKLIEISQSGNSYRISITPKSAHRLLARPINDLQIPKMSPWDTKWRMVTFDIPTGKNSERLYFYRKLKALGFTLADKSMWLHPYECRDEITLLADYLNISKYVHIHTISELDSKTLHKLTIPSS